MIIDNMLTNMNRIVSSHDDERSTYRRLTALLVDALLLVIMVGVLMLFGEYLWNNFARRLIPGLGKARWYDVFVLTILLRLMRI